MLKAELRTVSAAEYWTVHHTLSSSVSSIKYRWIGSYETLKNVTRTILVTIQQAIRLLLFLLKWIPWIIMKARSIATHAFSQSAVANRDRLRKSIDTQLNLRNVRFVTSDICVISKNTNFRANTIIVIDETMAELKRYVPHPTSLERFVWKVIIEKVPPTVPISSIMKVRAKLIFTDASWWLKPIWGRIWYPRIESRLRPNPLVVNWHWLP